jgi:hypothetical protein
LPEHNGKTELAGEEVATRLDIGDEQLRFGACDDGFGENEVCMIWHGVKSWLERLPAKERCTASGTSDPRCYTSYPGDFRAMPSNASSSFSRHA